MHDRGPDQADVTEGSGGVWERLHYDWSDPNRVVLTTTDSNVWGGRSGHTYTFTRQPDGTTDVDVVVVREGKNLKGRVIAIVFGIFGNRTSRRRTERPSKRWRPGTRSDPSFRRGDPEQVSDGVPPAGTITAISKGSHALEQDAGQSVRTAW